MQISWWTVAIQAVNFLVLVWLLQRFLYRPVQAIVEKRRQSDAEARLATTRAQAEAQGQKAHYEAARAGLEAERQAVLQEARAGIESERAKLLDDARKDAVARIARAGAEIDKAKAAAVAATRGELAGVAVGLAHRLLSDIAPSISNQCVLVRLETELAGLPTTERNRLDEQIRANGANLDVVTARPLLAAEEQAWRSRLELVLNHKLEMRFESDPSLIAGAILRLPHTAVRATWADQLERARLALAGGERGRDS